MANARRRALHWWILAGVALAATIVLGVFAMSDRDEYVARFASVATFDTDGTAHIDETIDYHFPFARHGIYRNLPDIAYDSQTTVLFTSDHTEAAAVVPFGDGVQIQIGDPDREVTGDHRYTISYPQATFDQDAARAPMRSTATAESAHRDVVAWDAVGAQWDVPIHRADIDLVAPWKWKNPRCDLGSEGDRGGCAVTQPSPGHLVVTSEATLQPGEGITITADRGARLASAPEPRELPSVENADPFTGRLAGTWLVMIVSGVGAAALVARLLRRVGRDRILVPSGSADAVGVAFAPLDVPLAGTESATTVAVDDTRLAEFTTTAFAPPRGLRPWQGSLVASEAVTDSAKLAWVLGAVSDGHLTAEATDTDRPLLRRAPSAPSDRDDTAARVARLFDGRDAITLGGPDPRFALLWDDLGKMMQAWLDASEIRDRSAESLVDRSQIGGVALAVLGAVAVVSAAFRVDTWGPVTLVVAGIGGIALFGGLTAFLRAWELRRRTPRGSAWWVQIESFRRFLESSEARHVTEAASRGVLREYTAWAVGLDEAVVWTNAVGASGVDRFAAGLTVVDGATSTARSSRDLLRPAPTTPSAGGRASSSSRSGGARRPTSRSGGGGGVGSGSGGGGGGSW